MSDLVVNDLILQASPGGTGGHLVVAHTLEQDKAAVIFENEALGNSGPEKLTGGQTQLGEGQL